MLNFDTAFCYLHTGYVSVIELGGQRGAQTKWVREGKPREDEGKRHVTEDP